MFFYPLSVALRVALLYIVWTEIPSAALITVLFLCFVSIDTLFFCQRSLTRVVARMMGTQAALVDILAEDTRNDKR